MYKIDEEKPYILKVKYLDKFYYQVHIPLILYIETDSEIIKLHMLKPLKSKGDLIYEIKLHCRDGIDKFIETLANKRFVQIHRKFAINKWYYAGHDSDWKCLKLRIPENIRTMFGDDREIELPVGKEFKKNVRTHLTDVLIHLRNKNEGSVYFSFFDIIYIESQRDKKILHLFVPEGNHPDNKYIFEFNKRVSLDKFSLLFPSDCFVRVHHDYLVNIMFSFVLNIAPDVGTISVEGLDNSFKKHPYILEEKIPLGSDYKENYYDLFNKKALSGR